LYFLGKVCTGCNTNFTKETEDLCTQCHTNQVLERQNNNPEETEYINNGLQNINNNNQSHEDTDNDSNQDDDDWEQVDLFDIPQDYYDPDDDDHDDEPDDGDDPFGHLSQLEKDVVNDFRSVVLQDNPISIYKVRVLLSIIKRLSVFKFPAYNSLFKPKYKVEVREIKYNPTNAPGSLTECRYVYIRFRNPSIFGILFQKVAHPPHPPLLTPNFGLTVIFLNSDYSVEILYNC